MKEGRWLLLIHQLPPKPDYFRVKLLSEAGSEAPGATADIQYAAYLVWRNM